MLLQFKPTTLSPLRGAWSKRVQSAEFEKSDLRSRKAYGMHARTPRGLCKTLLVPCAPKPNLVPADSGS